MDGGAQIVQPNKDERTWAMLSHVSTFAGYIIPFGNILGPLIIWLVKKSELPLVDDQGKEALNFQISMTLYSLVALALMFVLIGFLVLGALLVFDVVVTVLAAIRATEGRAYRYPLCIRLIK